MRLVSALLLLIWPALCLAGQPDSETSTGTESHLPWDGLTVGQWTALAKDENPELRKMAALALANYPQPDPMFAGYIKPAIPQLIAMLKEDDITIQVNAITALRRMTPKAKAVVPALAEVIRTKDGFVRMSAAWALARIDRANPLARSVLAEMAGAKRGRFRAPAALVLHISYPWEGVAAAAPGLIELLDRKESETRYMAAHALCRIKGRAQAAIPTLLEELKDAEAERRQSAAFALVRLGPEAKPAATALAAALKDKDGRVKVYAAQSLCNLDPVGPGVSFLAELMDTDDFELAADARCALEDLGPPSLPALVKLLKNKSDQARCAAMTALSRMGSEAKIAVPALIDILGHKSPPMRAMAADTLARIGPEAKAAMPALQKLQKDADPLVREAADAALERIAENP